MFGIVVGLSLVAAMVSDDMDDGIYLVSMNRSGKVVQRFDGAKVHLSERVTGKATNFKAVATNNSSTKFTLTFNYQLDSLLKAKNHIVLVVDGVASPTMHATYNQMQKWLLTLQCRGIGIEYAESVMKRFDGEIIRRTHPGHAVQVRWAGKQNKYTLGTPVALQFKVTNVGTVPFTFIDGGKQRGLRNNQFEFIVRDTSTGKALPEIKSSVNFGGLFAYRTLKPGEVFEREINLDDWFEISKPGSYEVTGLFELSVSDPDQDVMTVLWDDFAVDRFMLDISRE